MRPKTRAKPIDHERERRHRWAIGLYRRGFTGADVDSVLGARGAVWSAVVRRYDRAIIRQDHKEARAKRAASRHGWSWRAGKSWGPWRVQQQDAVIASLDLGRD